MNCAGPLSCAIADLVAALSNKTFDLEGFLTTIGATILGGLIAALVSWLLFLREWREQRAIRFDDALGAVVTASSEFAVELRRLHESGLEDELTGDSDSIRWEPYDFALIASIAKLRLIARRANEKSVANALRTLVLGARMIPVRQRIDLISTMWPALITWREDGDLPKLEQSLRAALAEAVSERDST